MSEKNEYGEAFSDKGFWHKLRKYAVVAGQKVVEKALLLYYAMQEEKAPAWAKATIAAALGYFIVPLDAIADLTPAVGYADDLGVLVLAIAAVAAYINEDVQDKTAAKMLAWFGDPGLDKERTEGNGGLEPEERGANSCAGSEE